MKQKRGKRDSKKRREKSKRKTEKEGNGGQKQPLGANLGQRLLTLASINLSFIHSFIKHLKVPTLPKTSCLTPE